MKHFIGIDLGTSFSSIATLDETGTPKIIHNNEGQNITPSCVTEIEGKFVVGEEARRTWAHDPESGEAAARFKRDMGTNQKHIIKDKEYTPTDMSALVLGKLKQDAASQIGEIAEAVVTIPANFSHEARQATLDAAEAAELNVRYIINEPTAAALYYAIKEGKKMHGVYAVYDLGGGTFDVSIINVNGHNVDVLATDGVRHLGGDDFDKVLFKIVGEKYREKTNESLKRRDYDDVEEDKKSLSKRKKIVAKAGRQAVAVTREEFESGIADLIAETENLCQSVMKKAEVSPSDISGILLAGGSTRTPLVQESVRRIFGKKPIATANVDEVVSMGAALYAAYKGDDKHLSTEQKESLSDIKIQEITSQCFGFIALSNSTRTVTNYVLIEKGTNIPCDKTEIFYTTKDGQQKVGCQVTEASTHETDPEKVSIIWDDHLGELPPDRPQGQEIKVTFSYDENQVMHCSFVDVKTGKRKVVDLSMTQSGGAMITLTASDVKNIE